MPSFNSVVGSWLDKNGEGVVGGLATVEVVVVVVVDGMDFGLEDTHLFVVVVFGCNDDDLFVVVPVVDIASASALATCVAVEFQGASSTFIELDGTDEHCSIGELGVHVETADNMGVLLLLVVCVLVVSTPFFFIYYFIISHFLSKISRKNLTLIFARIKFAFLNFIYCLFNNIQLLVG